MSDQNVWGQTPPPPVPAAVTLPPAGWYPDPQNPAGEKWFDGAAWTQVTRQRAAQQYGGAPGQPVGMQGQPFGRQGQARFRWVSNGPLGVVPSLVGVVIGLVFVAVSFFISASMSAPANMSAKATGTVTSVKVSQHTQTSSNGSRSSAPSCVPLAEFAVGGKTYMATMSVGLSPCPWTVGQQVAVAYDPASPAQAMIPATGSTRYVPWIFGGIGALVALACLFSVVRAAAALRAALRS